MGLEIAGRAARGATFLCILVVLGACVPICGIGAKFALTNAHVDSNYNCPSPSTNRPYDVHATIDASNSTSSTVTIKSMSETDQLVATSGNWDGPKDAKGGGPITNFQPKSIASGTDTTIKFSVGFECTSAGPPVTTYGEFSFKFSVVTSAGTFTLDSANHHRLTFPH